MVNVGLIGCGYWGPNLLRNLHQLEGATVSIVADLRPDRLNYVRRNYPGVKTTGSHRNLLRDPQLDAVVIATPASSHYALVKKALELGKHVLVEKPLALTTQECQELLDLANRKSRVLMVGHIFMYNAALNWLKEYLQGGEIGEVLYLYSQRLSLGRIRQDVNALWNFAPHDISILLYLLEEDPKVVSAKGLSCIQPGIEDVVFVNLDFFSGVSAHIHISWLDPQKVRRLTVVGTKKMIVYDDVSLDAKIKIYDKGVTKIPTADSPSDFETFGEFQLLLRSGDVHLPAIRFPEPLQTECAHFIDCIEKGTTPLTDGEHGLRVVRVLEAAQRSMNSGGVPAEV